MILKGLNILRDNEIPVDAWNDFVRDNQYSSPFQTSDYFNFIKRVPGFDAEAVAVEKSGRIVGVSVKILHEEPGLKGFFSRRAIIYGGPLFIHGMPEVVEILIDAMKKPVGREQIYTEVRNLSDYGETARYYLNTGWKYVPYLNLYIDMTSKNSLPEILKGMSYNRRREIQLSLKNGSVVEECKSTDDLADLYSILSDLYENVVKLPLPPFDFFRLFREMKIGPLFVVKHNSDVIGGSICPVLQNRKIYTLYYCGLRHYRKDIYPSHLSILGALEYALQNNIKMLDFMGAGKPGEEYGVRNYKKEFGTSQVEYGRFLMINKPFLYRIGKTGVSVMKKF